MDKLLEEYSTADAVAEEIISEKHQVYILAMWPSYAYQVNA